MPVPSNIQTFPACQGRDCWRRPHCMQRDVRSAAHGNWARPDQQNFGFGLLIFTVCLLRFWWFFGSRGKSCMLPLEIQKMDVMHLLKIDGLIWSAVSCSCASCQDIVTMSESILEALSCKNLDMLFWRPGHRSRSSRCSLQSFRLCVRHAMAVGCCRVSCGAPLFELRTF